MVKFTNVTEDALWVPLISQVVEPGASFEVAPEYAESFAHQPSFAAAKKVTPAKQPAAKKAAPEATPDAPAEPQGDN